MWEENNGSYYRWEKGTLDNRNLVGSLIYSDKNDGKYPDVWHIQIHTSDGGLIVINRVKNTEFIPRLAKAIVDMALKENQTFRWWATNRLKWWYEKTIIT